MGTKLKNFSRNLILKLTAYVLIVACAGGFLFTYIAYRNNVGEMQAINSKSFAESEELCDEIARLIRNLRVIQYDYISEENIRSGNCISTERIVDQIYESDHYYEMRERYYQQQMELEERTWVDEDGNRIGPTLSDILRQAVTRTEEETAEAEAVQALISEAQMEELEMYDEGYLVRYIREYPQLVNAQLQTTIDNQLENFRRINKYLQSQSGKFYYHSYRDESGSVLSNAALDAISSAPIVAQADPVDNCIYIKQGSTVLHTISMNGYYHYNGSYRTSMSYSYNSDYDLRVEDTLTIGVDDNYLAEREAVWAQARNESMYYIVAMLSIFALAGILFIYLLVVTGKRPNSDEVHLYMFDRVYTEVFAVIFILMFAMLDELYYSFGYYGLLGRDWFIIVAGMVFTAYMLFVVLSLLRSFKAKRFIRSFLIGRLGISLVEKFPNALRGLGSRIWKLLRKFPDTIHDIWSRGPLMVRAMAFAVGIPLLCIFWFTIPILMIVSGIVVYRVMVDYETVRKGVAEVRNGNQQHKIFIARKGDLHELAEDINALSDGLGAAISSEVRAQRMKTELISNVSHDIKTPLTSIISYVDLLKKQMYRNEPDMEKSRQYVDIIEQKTGRLRVLTSDLFEMSKATSGNLSMTLEQVDMSALVRQGLGEFDNRLRESSLDVRVNMPEPPISILADGHLVWRILENMLSNVVKYAMHGSRVYIDVIRTQSEVTLHIKNISAYELNVSADQLMERFSRGDESRSSEGSGLGLSIASSLAQAQGGTFEITVDGDLFKATLVMPAFREKK